MALLLPAGDAKLSFIDARDVAAVAVKALTGDSQEVREKNIINCFRQNIVRKYAKSKKGRLTTRQ
jgi:hypothetical protein